MYRNLKTSSSYLPVCPFLGFSQCHDFCPYFCGHCYGENLPSSEPDSLLVAAAAAVLAALPVLAVNHFEDLAQSAGQAADLQATPHLDLDLDLADDADLVGPVQGCSGLKH